MSDPTSSFSTSPEFEDRPEPGVWVIPRPKQRWWLYILFFLLTGLSTMVVGARMESNFLLRQPIFSMSDNSLPLFPISWILHHPSNLLMGLPFSLTLMFILFAHEMGHYLYARYYRVYVTPPFFVPCPYLSLFGTLGAFIRIKSSIPSRAALFDIGIAGPIAGFIPACAAMIYGLSLSRPITGPASQALQLGFPLAFDLAARALHIAIPLTALSLHPVAAAAWVGMFATALNLLPAGQLDGGHIVFSIAPRLHRWISMLAILALVPLGKYCWMGWFLWAVVLAMTLRHPTVPRYPQVNGGRRMLALFALLMFVLAFTPAPIANSSGREVWAGARDTLNQFRTQIHHFLHKQ